MRTNRVLRAGVLTASIAGTLGSVGCSTMNNTEKGAAVGGGIGTVAGAGLGAITHHPVAGAIVGGVTGAAIGGITGADKDDRQERARDVQQAQAVATQAQQRMLTVPDVVHLAQQGHAEQVIINQIRATGSSFQLTAGDLDYLKNNGVTDRVIAEMQTARPSPTAVVVQPQPGPTVIYERPYYSRPYYPAPVIIAPRPYYGYGYGYRRW
ncbi:MAG: complement resistance protein TraT [Planctomycetes bacterium]|nr:complement resistance protein TraT [Planctomycetota bacterium]